MSENQNIRTRDLSKYDTMTTEELEEILRLDVDAPEGQESDTETLLYVMEVLANRKRNTSHTENTAQRAYESFLKNYLPEVEEKIIAPEKKKISSQKRPLRWLRGLSAVAALLVIILLGSVTAKAFGYDIWEAVAKWTQETFHFGDGRQADNGPGVNNDLPYASLQDALLEDEISEQLVPTWIPDGYQLIKIIVDESPLQNVYNAQYKNGDKEIKITIRNYLNSNPEYIEQSDDFGETYESSGVTYYLLTNNNRIQAIWINGSYECYILGDLTIDELKTMIDSIGKG